SSQEITTPTFVVQVAISGGTPTSVDIALDGANVGTKNSAPYGYTVTGIKKGWQTLTATAHFASGNPVQNSIRVNLNAP
ncbi:MAG: Ig-like domain-containing protein, partial [Candidatus Doudnabacteria bacterium]